MAGRAKCAREGATHGEENDLTWSIVFCRFPLLLLPVLGLFGFLFYVARLSLGLLHYVSHACVHTMTYTLIQFFTPRFVYTVT